MPCTDATHSLTDALGVPVGSEPTEVTDELFVQQVDARVRQSWAEIWSYPLPVLFVAGLDPIVAEELTVVPGAANGKDPHAFPAGPRPLRIGRTASGTVLRLSLPLLSRPEVDLAGNGDELVVTVASYRRLLTLPAGLARHRVAAARVEDGELRVRCEENTS